jgi:protocatechuate 3,4-dioxygenase beta subunit
VSWGGFVTQARAVDVADGQLLDRIELQLSKAAVIAGTVLDEFGDPLVRAPVSVLRQQYQDGERRLVEARTLDQLMGIGGTGDIADDRGQFRLFGLPPGTYYLAVGEPTRDSLASPANVNAEAMTFYPGRPSPAEAQPLTVRDGDELAGLTFAFMRIERATIRGTVLSREGRPVRGGTLVSRSHGGPGRSFSVGADGSFAVADLVPGEYILIVREGDDAAMARVAPAGGENVTVTLQMSPGLQVRGRIVFDTGTPASEPARSWAWSTPPSSSPMVKCSTMPTSH